MERNLTQGSITGNLIRFTLPLIAGNIFQQFYNLADTWIVGRYIGADALAAVGSSYTLMVFLTSIFIGLCMGSGGVFSMYYGKGDTINLKKSIGISFAFIGIVALGINIAVFLGLDFIIDVFQVPTEITGDMKSYLKVIFAGMFAVFLYNYFANLLRSVGNSVVPLVMLGLSAILNIALDLLFVISFDMGVSGAAFATIISQLVSALGLIVYTFVKVPMLRIGLSDLKFERDIFKLIGHMSVLTCVQQSVMNFGILLVQGLVNSFGTVVLAAFAAAVKIDTLAYTPLQDFGNGVSTFIAQNYGAKKKDRILQGIKASVIMISVFSLVVSAVVFVFAEPLMSIFVGSGETEIVRIGAQYLKTEGAFYIGIGILFMLYGLYRALLVPSMSLILTIISLGTRVVLAYTLSSVDSIGVFGIWISVPIGWALADIFGVICYKRLDLFRFDTESE